MAVRRQKKKKRKERGVALNPQAVATYRTGYTRLVYVKQFRDAYLDFLSKFTTEDDDMKNLPQPDLSLEEVTVETPFQVVERSINEEVNRLQGRPGLDEKKALDGKRRHTPVDGLKRKRREEDGRDLGGREELPDPDDPDFGINIPNMQALTTALQPLRQRKKKITKPGRKEVNCMTKKTFEYDIKCRTEGRDPIPVRDCEVLLRVAFFHPTNYSKTQEFTVLGSQQLTALKDRVYCLSNKTLDGPHTPSSFFFIENKFYDDLRDRRGIRYSDVIINWVKQENRYAHPGLSHFERGSMNETTFADLSIRLGSHYLFGHQGDCEHVFIFTDIRIKTSKDCQNALAYPTRPFQCKTRRRKCCVCDLYPATYVTYGDKLASENPFFYCEECYRPLHYSYEGNLLYNDFQVYSYDHE